MNVSDLFAVVIRRFLLCFLIVVVAMVGFSHAQGSGSVTVATSFVPVFTNQATGASSGGIWQCGTTPCAALPDLGSAANYLNYCNTGFSGTIDLEWSPNPGVVAYIPLSLARWTTDSNCHTIQVGGYFPNLRSTLAPTAGSVTAWYTASSAPIAYLPPALSSNGQTAPVSCDQNTVFTQTSDNAVHAIAGVNALTTGDVVVVCGFTVSFSAATSASGNYWFGFCTPPSCSPFRATHEEFTTVNTPQRLFVPFLQRGLSGQSQTWVLNNSGSSLLISVSWASIRGSLL